MVKQPQSLGLEVRSACPSEPTLVIKVVMEIAATVATVRIGAIVKMKGPRSEGAPAVDLAAASAVGLAAVPATTTSKAVAEEVNSYPASRTKAHHCAPRPLRSRTRINYRCSLLMWFRLNGAMRATSTWSSAWATF